MRPGGVYASGLFDQQVGSSRGRIVRNAVLGRPGRPAMDGELSYEADNDAPADVEDGLSSGTRLARHQWG